jgi:DNA repair protein RadC
MPEKNNQNSQNSQNNQKENPHKNHRGRMRERYRKNGADSLQPHEFAELLLYYAVPRVNTNKTAHELMGRFKNIANILDADENALKEVNGVSDNAALFFKILADTVRMYNTGKLQKMIDDVRNKAYYEEYLVQYYKTEATEKVLLLTLNAKMGVISEDVICVGSVNSVKVDMRKMAKTAIDNNASGIILAHNHPDGTAVPSPDDIETTKRILNVFTELNINFIDHYVVAGEQIASIRDKLVKSYFD